MSNLRKILFVFCTVFIVFSLVACGKTNTNQNKNEITFNGESINLPTNAEKIVSLVPSITETLVNLELSDKIVAIDNYSKDIDGISQELPTFDSINPDMESLILLEPDIIFTTILDSNVSKDIYKDVQESGTFIAFIPTQESIYDILETVKFIGAITKADKRANEIYESYSKEVKKITDVISSASIEEPIKVYFEAAGQNWTFGKDTFLNDMIQTLGAKNIFDDQENWIKASEEQVIDKNPDVILTNTNYIENPVEEIKSRKGWESINAIKNNKVYFIDPNSSQRANEFSINAFIEIANAIYPELFNE